MRKYRFTKKTPLFPKIVVIALVLATVIGLYLYQRYQYLVHTPVDAQSVEEVIFTINKGDSSSKIAQKLYDQGLILDVDTFKIYSKLEGIDKDIRKGRFALLPNMNIPEIIDVITSDQQVEIIVTFPEGSTVSEFDQILTENNLIESREFEQAVQNFSDFQSYDFLEQETMSALSYPLEGYLFPDTYYINPNNFNSEVFISTLLSTFKQRINSIETDSERPLAEIVNVAAMVEEEANQDVDRPIVAGIIWKRLDENWLLGIDATLLYQAQDREITYQDLQEDSPYNTRKNMGLPPGPITNPGLKSLEAAFNPQATEYYYYLTSQAGEMKYARDEAEHNSNKRKFL